MRKNSYTKVNLLGSYSVIAMYDLEEPGRPPSSGEPKRKNKNKKIPLWRSEVKLRTTIKENFYINLKV